MKKVLALILALALLILNVAVADEIKFRGLEWGCGTNEVEKVFNTKDTYYCESWNDFVIPKWDELYSLGSNVADSTPCGWQTYITGDFKVAGHSVNQIRLFGIWDIDDNETLLKDKKESQLCYAVYCLQNVRNYNFTYSDLCLKLSLLYGDCIKTDVDGSTYYVNEGTFVDTHTKTATWMGDNNTAVSVYCYYLDTKQTAFNKVYIMYGKTDTDEKLERVLEAAHKELEEQERQEAMGNMDGL